MMDQNARPNTSEGEAVLEYGTPEFRVIKKGSYVKCAVTGVHIPLADLKYWSVEHQQAYASPEAIMKRKNEG
jgi:hypothetical protein